MVGTLSRNSFRESRSRSSAFRTLALAMAFPLLLGACAGQTDEPAASPGTPAPAPTENEAETGPAVGGDLVVALGALSPTLDPFITAPSPPRSFTVAPLYPHLTYVDGLAAGAPVIPGVAESWTEDDDLTWTFKIRSGLTFPNGEAMDAGAVKFAVDWIKGPDSGSGIASRIGPIDSVEVVDALTLKVNLTRRSTSLPRTMSLVALVPPQLFTATGKDAFFLKPESGGYFRVENFTPGESLRLVRNDDSVMGVPLLDSVTFRVIVEDSSRVAALLAGEVDVITKVPTDQAARVDGGEGVSVLNHLEPRLYHTDLYSTEGPLRDFRVRQALNLAVDSETLVNTVMGGYGVPELGQLHPPGIAGHCDTVNPIGFDLARANQLMADAGVSGLTFTYVSSQGFLANDALLAQAIAEMLMKLDAVDLVEVKVLEFSNYLDIFFRRVDDLPDMFAWGMSAASTLDGADNFSRFTTTADRSLGYSSDTFDSIYSRYTATPEGDPAKQVDACRMAEILREDAPVLFGLYMPDLWGYSDDVSGFQVSLGGNPTWHTFSLER
jgi:peptide/nickel transport system substrate-binding protein